MPISKFKSFLKNNFPISSYLFKNKNQILNLGRWGVECEKGKGILADNANVDHCGPCGTSSIEEHIRDVAIKNNNLRIKELKQELKKTRQESMPIKKG